MSNPFRPTLPRTSEMLRESLKAVAPILSKTLHKGQCGRVAVFGGSEEYSGAPYFAAISALKAGADLSYVVCPREASTVIKSYSPELIVYPTLHAQPKLDETLTSLTGRLHSVVIGPGFGRTRNAAESFKTTVEHFKSINLPMVIDADGLYFVSEDPNVVRNRKSIILTPNVNKEIEDKDDPENVRILSHKMGGLTILRKGETDVMSDGEKILGCESDCSGRRCGGQGDLLSGSLTTFLFWTYSALHSQKTNVVLKEYGPELIAAYGACLLTKECNRLAFQKYGRSTTTENMVNEIGCAVRSIFD